MQGKRNKKPKHKLSNVKNSKTISFAQTRGLEGWQGITDSVTDFDLLFLATAVCMLFGLSLMVAFPPLPLDLKDHVPQPPHPNLSPVVLWFDFVTTFRNYF